MENKKYIVILEIASSRISASAAVMNIVTKDITEVCHYEEEINGCVRYGSIVNVDEVYSKTNIVFKKIEENKKINSRKIEGVYIGLDARSLHNETRDIEKEISEEFPISESMINNIQKEVETQFQDVDVLGVVMGKCEIDGKEVSNPIGSIGKHLSISMNVIVCKKQILKNIQMVLNRLKVRLLGINVTPLAVADLILGEKEKQIGCMLVDLGADTTTVSIYKNGHLAYLNVLPMGSRHITRDLITLNIMEDEAERVKRSFGLLPESDIPETNFTTAFQKTDAANYIKSRAGEIVENIVNQMNLAEIPADQLADGIIAIGRGMRLNGLTDMLAHVSRMNVRIGSISEFPNDADSRDRIQSLAILDAVSKTTTESDEECMSMPILPKLEELSKLPELPQQPEKDEKEKESKKAEPDSNSKKKKGLFGRITGAIGRAVDTRLYNDDDDDDNK